MLITAVLGCLGFAPTALAQDAVYQRSSSKSGGNAKWTGTIVDYTGRELQLTLSTGTQRKFPAQQVARVETAYRPEQLAGDQAFAARRFDHALAQYTQALRSEKRNWVRRQILAQQVWCYRALGQTAFAVNTFRSLVESDPDTLYFDCIPLAWHTLELTDALEREAQGWLDSDSALDVLIGLSYLMSTARREPALRRAEELAAHEDRRIAGLAQAQAWRGTAATATAEDLARWDRLLEKIPPELRAGPYWIIGGEWARRKSHDQAALRLLRVPILYPRERSLSARSLLAAAESLEASGQVNEAAGLYQEILAGYEEIKDVKTEATERLRALADKQK